MNDTVDAVLKCTCADGEKVVVLVKNGEPRVEMAIGMRHRIVRTDGTVVLEDVVEVSRAELVAPRA